MFLSLINHSQDKWKNVSVAALAISSFMAASRHVLTPYFNQSKF